MAFKRILAAGLAAAALSVSAGAAQAASVFFELTGKVTAGSATPAPFGVVDLSGRDFKITFEIDPTIGLRSPPGPLGTDFYYMVDDNASGSPLRSVSVEIAGQTKDTDVTRLSADTSVSFSNGSAGPYSSIGLTTFAGAYVPSPAGGQSYEYLAVSGSWGGAGILAADLSSWTPASVAGGLNFTHQAQWENRAGYDYYYSFTAQVTGGRLYDAAAVPEPATWALMISGFGGAGAMLRRRRVAAA